MKTVGRITITLAILLVQYVFSYWLLFKNNRGYTVFEYSIKLFGTLEAYEKVVQVFNPIRELDTFLNVEVPMRKFLIGHWTSDNNSDFVTFGPHQECRFQLGEFAFEGKAEFNGVYHGFIIEFDHQGMTHHFIFKGDPKEFRLSGPDRAFAHIELYTDLSDSSPTDFTATLTKHPANAPAP